MMCQDLTESFWLACVSHGHALLPTDAPLGAAADDAHQQSVGLAGGVKLPPDTEFVKSSLEIADRLNVEHRQVVQGLSGKTDYRTQQPESVADPTVASRESMSKFEAQIRKLEEKLTNINDVPDFRSGDDAKDLIAHRHAIVGGLFDRLKRTAQVIHDFHQHRLVQQFSSATRVFNRTKKGADVATAHGGSVRVQQIHIARTKFDTEFLPPSWVSSSDFSAPSSHTATAVDHLHPRVSSLSSSSSPTCSRPSLSLPELDPSHSNTAALILQHQQAHHSTKVQHEESQVRHRRGIAAMTGGSSAASSAAAAASEAHFAIAHSPTGGGG
eukprot:Selendium_serpulae@DN4341_c0_g1_i1.p1